MRSATFASKAILESIRKITMTESSLKCSKGVFDNRSSLALSRTEQNKISAITGIKKSPLTPRGKISESEEEMKTIARKSKKWLTLVVSLEASGTKLLNTRIKVCKKRGTASIGLISTALPFLF
jgi:hypothetical protein